MYRAMIRGRLSPDDATKIFFCLREIRRTVEMEITAAAAAAVAEAETAATRAATTSRSPQINFVVIPTGHSVIGDHVVPNEGANTLGIEHQPEPEEVVAPLADILLPEPAPEPKLEPELQSKSEPAQPVPVPETYMERLHRLNREAEARGECVVMREPKTEARWPKGPSY